MIPKRVFWLAVGAAAGAGASLRAQQVVRKKVAPYTPENLPATIVGGVRSIGDGVRGAVDEGRTTMREHEARMRAGLPSGPGRRDDGARGLRAVPTGPGAPGTRGSATTPAK